MTQPADPELDLSIEDVRAHLTERGALELELATQRAANAKLQELLRGEVAARVAAENELASVRNGGVGAS